MTTATLTPVDGASPRVVRERELIRRFAEFVADARDALDVELPDCELGDGQHDAALAVVTAVALLSLEELRATRRRGPRVSALCDLALRGADLAADIRDRDLRRRQRALAGVESTLRHLRRIGTADELVDVVCKEIVNSCGFSRAMLSRVDGDTWMPWKAHFRHRELRDSDREWMANARIPLNTMFLESEVLKNRQSACVVDVEQDPRASHAFTAATGTTSYAVAPIVPAGRVIGFLHGDHYPSVYPVDEVDCHILGELAEGFGRIYERAVLIDRLHRQRDHVRETLKAAEAIMDNLARAEIELVRRADERASTSTATTLALAGETAAIDELLTPREREVIALLVTGQTNSAIAERLVISEGTVKSHVKQILRKLGAVNRSEVIARYLGMIASE
jgi:DNA-binding CsgD family transcriptional regulator